MGGEARALSWELVTKPDWNELSQHTAAQPPHFTVTPKSNVDKTLNYGQQDVVGHNILFTSPGSFPCSFDLSLLARMGTRVTGIDHLLRKSCEPVGGGAHL